MNYSGVVQNGVVIFDNGMGLPEGTRVYIEVLEQADEPLTLYERLKDFIGKGKGLPEDLAENHDHYLHGQPKKPKQ